MVPFGTSAVVATALPSLPAAPDSPYDVRPGAQPVLRRCGSSVEGRMESLESLGIFFAGLGVLFISFGLFWFISEWKDRYTKE